MHTPTPSATPETIPGVAARVEVKVIIVDEIEYRGVMYRRYPHHPKYWQRNYYRGKRDGKWGYLHRHVYEDNFGPIPDGHQVHHRDGDPLNNAPANLVALTRKGHMAAHWTPERRDDQRQRFIAQAHPAAREWHLSERGRALHRRLGKKSWEGKKRVPAPAPCAHCGKPFDTYYPTRARFCSNRCLTAARVASGVDNVVKRCAVCDAPFVVNKYANRKTCSPRCSAELRSRVRREKT